MTDQTGQDPKRTYQLRRYQIEAGQLDSFIEWWTTLLAPARQAFGFRVEFAYPVPASGEFVWAVSRAGDEAEFIAADAAWQVSPERTAAFLDQPKRIASVRTDFVRPLA